MANQGAKKRVEENGRRLAMLRWLLVAGLVGQLAGLAWSMHRGRATTRQWLGAVGSSGLAWAMYSFIARLAAPAYAAGGELLDGGADLNRGGVCGYYHDVLYITVFVQVDA